MEGVTPLRPGDDNIAVINYKSTRRFRIKSWLRDKAWRVRHPIRTFAHHVAESVVDMLDDLE